MSILHNLPQNETKKKKTSTSKDRKDENRTEKRKNVLGTAEERNVQAPNDTGKSMTTDRHAVSTANGQKTSEDNHEVNQKKKEETGKGPVDGMEGSGVRQYRPLTTFANLPFRERHRKLNLFPPSLPVTIHPQVNTITRPNVA